MIARANRIVLRVNGNVILFVYLTYYMVIQISVIAHLVILPLSQDSFLMQGNLELAPWLSELELHGQLTMMVL